MFSVYFRGAGQDNELLMLGMLISHVQYNRGKRITILVEVEENWESWICARDTTRQKKVSGEYNDESKHTNRIGLHLLEEKYRPFIKHTREYAKLLDY
jgi:hypothetical protein